MAVLTFVFVAAATPASPGFPKGAHSPGAQWHRSWTPLRVARMNVDKAFIEQCRCRPLFISVSVLLGLGFIWVTGAEGGRKVCLIFQLQIDGF